MIWMPSTEQRDLRTLLRHHHQWVRLRSRVQHTLQSMALNHGLRRGHALWNQAGQHALRALPLAPHANERRKALMTLYPCLQESIEKLDRQVSQQVDQHPPARRLLSVCGDANDQNLPQSGRLLYCVRRGVAVEKLAHCEFRKKLLRVRKLYKRFSRVS